MIIHARNFVTSDDALGEGKIQRSLRFNSADSAHLTRAVTTTGNQKIWTFSCWFKRTENGYKHRIYSCNDGNSGYIALYFHQSYDELYTYFDPGNNYGTVSGRKFRDTTSWMHIVHQVDASNTVQRIWINGEELSLNSGRNPGNNNYPMNKAGIDLYIGRASWSSTAANHLNGYLAEVYLVDGSLIAPTDFAFTDPVTGAWMPKRYEGTFGTNGFYLDFSDNSSTSALGKDRSPNGNHFTVNNFSVSAGKDNDSLEDTPTNNFCIINPLDTYRTGNTVAEGGLKLTRTGSNFGNARGSMAVNSGKWYYEWECTGQHNQVGWVNTGFDINYNGGDVAVTSGGGGGVGMYWDSRTYMYGWQNSQGNSYFPSSTTGQYVSYTTGDIIMVAVDLDTFKFWFGKNGTWINVLGTADPAAGTDGITPVASKNNGTYEAGMYFTPLISCFSNGSGYVNFGQRPFSYTIPSGYKTLHERNIPLASTSVVRPQKHFETLLYTGTDTSAARTIDDLEFAPDLVWQKRRNGTNWQTWHDTVRGVGKTLYSNDTSGEATNNQYGYISSFNKDGFTWSPGSTNNSDGNESSGTFVSWCWKAGGAAVTNNDGSVASQVSANTEAGFSICTWTGTGSNLTFGHGLGKKPDWVITKARTGSSGCDWFVYHKDIGATHNLRLNTQDASSTASDLFNNTEPTSSVFSIGNSSCINENGGTYISYCWTGISGYSKFGSYTGSGNADGPFVELGFKPAWLLLRNTNGDIWYLYDNKRNTFNVVDKELNPNRDQAEASFTTADFLSNGFKIRTSNSSFNYSGYTYLYMAFAEQPGTTPFATFPNAR